jgi:hypothetical protein
MKLTLKKQWMKVSKKNSPKITTIEEHTNDELTETLVAIEGDVTTLEVVMIVESLIKSSGVLGSVLSLFWKRCSGSLRSIIMHWEA